MEDKYEVPQHIIDEAARLNFIQDKIEFRLFRCADVESLLFYNGNNLVSVVENKEDIGKVIHTHREA